MSFARWPINRPKNPGWSPRRLVEDKVIDGHTTKAECAKAKHGAEFCRQVHEELKQIEARAVDPGHMAKNWCDQFK